MITMRHTVFVTGMFLILSANTAAATPATADAGLITADAPAPLYAADVFVDDLLKPPGDRIHERASEAIVAAEANNTAAMQRAVAKVSRVANRTNGVEAGDGLQQVAQLLQEVRDKVPEKAHPGIDTALDNVQRAQNQFPTDQRPGEGGPDTMPP